jgi:hypothetical protein
VFLMETRSQFVSIMPQMIELHGACFNTHRLMAQSVHNVWAAVPIRPSKMKKTQ